MKRLLNILLVLIIGLGTTQAYNEHLTTWPTEGLVSHWDLHKDYVNDLVRGIPRDTTKSSRHSNYHKEYLGTTAMTLPLPSDMWTIHQPHTILLRLVNHLDDDLEKLSIGLPIGLTADDDELECTLFHDSLLVGAQTDYSLPLLWLAYSDRSSSSHEAVIAITIESMERSHSYNITSPRSPIRDSQFYSFRVGIASKGRYVTGYKGVNTKYRLISSMNIACDAGWSIGHASGIYFNEVAIYNRLLTPEEIQQAIGTDNMKVETPADYSPRFGWAILPYSLLAVLLFLLLILQGKHTYTYISPKRLEHSPGVGDKEQAHRLMAEAQECFGPADDMKVPSDDRLAQACQCLDDAIANGYCDDEMLAEYNRIASLINHCRQMKNTTGEAFFWVIPFILIFGVVITGYDYGTYLTIWTKQEMAPYYLTMLLCALIGMRLQGGETGQAIKAEQVKQLKPSLMGKFDDWLQKLGAMTSGVTASSVVSGVTALQAFLAFVLYAVAIGLRVMLACIYEFVIVVVGTGEVVASGVGGLAVGLVGGVAVFGLLWWLFMKTAWMLINLFLWVAIPAAGVAALYFIVTGVMEYMSQRRRQ